MVEVDILRWRVRLDAERTDKAYALTPLGGAAACQCAYCRNYLKQRERAFTPRVLEIFQRLGIPPEKDLEVVEYGPADEGRRLYGTWFYVAGTLGSAGGTQSGDGGSAQFEDIGDGMSLRISAETAFVPPHWRGVEILMVEVNVALPWVLDELPE